TILDKSYDLPKETNKLAVDLILPLMMTSYSDDINELANDHYDYTKTADFLLDGLSNEERDNEIKKGVSELQKMINDKTIVEISELDHQLMINKNRQILNKFGSFAGNMIQDLNNDSSSPSNVFYNLQTRKVAGSDEFENEKAGLLSFKGETTKSELAMLEYILNNENDKNEKRIKEETKLQRAREEAGESFRSIDYCHEIYHEFDKENGKVCALGMTKGWDFSGKMFDAIRILNDPSLFETYNSITRDSDSVERIAYKMSGLSKQQDKADYCIEKSNELKEFKRKFSEIVVGHCLTYVARNEELLPSSPQKQFKQDIAAFKAEYAVYRKSNEKLINQGLVYNTFSRESLARRPLKRIAEAGQIAKILGNEGVEAFVECANMTSCFSNDEVDLLYKNKEQLLGYVNPELFELSFSEVDRGLDFTSKTVLLDIPFKLKADEKELNNESNMFVYNNGKGFGLDRKTLESIREDKKTNELSWNQYESDNQKNDIEDILNNVKSRKQQQIEEANPKKQASRRKLI
ncbi:TPA: hypothetical protein ACN35C_004739, partial [Vibrio parahaemolyticus]